MRYWASVLAALLLTGAAFAESSSDDGITAAEEVCSRQLLPSDVRTCLGIVRDAKYLDVQAVEVCGRQFLPSDVRNCLTGIRDKTYRPAILETCGKLFLPSDVVACLIENGKPWGGDTLDVQQVRNGIRLALRYLREFDVRKAETVLKELLKMLDN